MTYINLMFSVECQVMNTHFVTVKDTKTNRSASPSAHVNFLKCTMHIQFAFSAQKKIRKSYVVVVLQKDIKNR